MVLAMKEIRGVIEAWGKDPKTGKELHKRVVVIRDLNTLQYKEIDVSDKINQPIKQVVKEVIRNLKSKGIKVIVPRHLKWLEGD